MDGIRGASGLLAAALVLSACAAEPSGDAALVITPATYDHLQDYQRLVQQGRAAAFAVSHDGAASYIVYCESGNCNGQYNFSQEAIRGCEKFGHGRCVVLASNGRIKRSYTVAEGSAGAMPSQGTATDFVSGDRIRQELSGNSIVEANAAGSAWAEYFAPDGTLRGRTDDGRRFDGLWKIDGNTLCVDYRSIARDWCGQFAEGADGSIDYYENGRFKKSYPRSVLQQGNPQNL
jgi:hypothetical protein